MSKATIDVFYNAIIGLFIVLVAMFRAVEAMDVTNTKWTDDDSFTCNNSIHVKNICIHVHRTNKKVTTRMYSTKL